MEQYFLKPFIFLFFIFMTLISHSKTMHFEIKPFPTEPSTNKSIKQGLTFLYKNNISQDLLNIEINKASQFQSFLYSTLNNQIAQNNQWPIEVTEKRLTGNFVKETTVRFASLIQRPNNHAANTVVARIYESTIERPNCDYKYPTTIFLHHILNEVGMIEDVSKLMAAGVLSQPAIYVVIHLPHYGERKQGPEEFLTSDLNAFRKNIAQLILDTHMLRNYLETKNNINSSKISLSGISLGAVMGLTVGAFDQGFYSYGNLVGGGDMANILVNRATTRPNSEVAIALKDLKLDESLMRNELAQIDSMTWLHRYQNKKIFILSATRDDIINYNNSVTPLLNQLKAQGNSITHQLNNDTHSPSGSAINKLTRVFLPLLRFTVDGSQSIYNACPQY